MNDMKQILLGAAVAAALILPVAAHAGEDRTWVSKPAQTFNARSLDLEHVFGDATIKVTDGGPMSVQISGPRFLVDPMQVTTRGDTLVVMGPRNTGRGFSVWDWSKWFDYSDVGEKGKVKVTISVPRGSDVTADKQIGDLTMGDLDGHFSVESINSDIRAGRVTDAKIKVVGGGDTTIAAVAGNISLDIAGAGDVNVGNVGSATIQVAGAGDTTLGQVHSGLSVSIAGSGDLDIASVNGPVTLSIAGSGDVRIKGGKANPFKVSMVGGGDVVFGGQAVDPTVSALGSGDVWIKSYTGNLSSSGMADVHIGDRDFPPMRPMRPMPPMPSIPAPNAPNAPPAPPAPPHHH